MFNFFSKKTPEKLWFATDIHCHIIPGIDDGSPSAEKSVELVENMQAWGIERIFASPHVTQGSFPNTPETIAAARKKLQDALDAKGNPLQLANSAAGCPSKTRSSRSPWASTTCFSSCR